METDEQLLDASFRGQVNTVKALLLAGANTNSKNERGQTPLHRAASQGHYDVIKVLLSEGADKNVREAGEHTPLHCAASQGHSNVANILLEAGAYTNARDEKGGTPLHWAAYRGYLKAASELLKANADKNARDKRGLTPLHWAAFNVHADVTSLLLGVGADKDAKDMKGYTPLHKAAQQGNFDVVLVMLAAGASITIKNSHGKRAIDVASKTVLLAFKFKIRRSKGLTGNYHRKELLGKGCYGSVYLCTNMDTGQDFALKQVDVANGIADKEFRALQNETDILKRLDHPNIVIYFGSGYLNGCFGIEMEYVAGGSMRSYIKKHGPLKTAFARECLFYILDGISYLHSNQIIHRDLKADNILRTIGGTIKIADFGISKQVSTLMSGTDSFVGTPYWMAPEVIRGKKYTDKVDMWGVGVTAFEFVSGNPPFFNCEPLQAIYRIGQVENMKKELRFPDRVNKSLKEFIFNCVQVKPHRRPSAHDALGTKYFCGLVRSKNNHSY